MSFPIWSLESDRHGLFQHGDLQIELLREFDGAQKPEPCARRRDIRKRALEVGPLLIEDNTLLQDRGETFALATISHG
jgi:hypothetical protein